MSDIKKIFAQVAKNVRPIRKKFCSARKKNWRNNVANIVYCTKVNKNVNIAMN